MSYCSHCWELGFAPCAAHPLPSVILQMDLTSCALQGPLAKGLKVGTSVRVAEGVKLKGGAAKVTCKTRVGQDKAEAGQVSSTHQ